MINVAPPVNISGSAEINPKIKSERVVEMNPRPSLLRERTQFYDAKVMRYYWNRRDELPREWIWMLNALYDQTTNVNEFKTTYTLKGYVSDLGIGRVYATNNGSLETLPRQVRADLCAKFYHDVDIANAQPVILNQYAKRFGLELKNLEAYCKNRDKVLTKLTELYGSRDVAKQEIISCLYGSKHTDFTALQVEMEKLVRMVKKLPEWIDVYERVRRNKPDNVDGAFLSQVAQTLERQVLDYLDEYFTSKGFSVDVLAYDGMMIRRGDDVAFPTPILREAELYVAEKTDFNIQLVEKPLVCKIPADELDKIKILTPQEKRWELVMNGTPSALAEFYALEKNGEVIYSESKKSYYIYKKHLGIWNSDCSTDINNDVSRVLTKQLQEMTASIPVLAEDATEKQQQQVKLQHSKLQQAIKFAGKNATQIVSQYLPTYVKPDFEPVVKFNQQEDLLPLQNGVFSFSQNKLLTYKPEYYFTFKIPINYNPDADTTDIETAMRTWFMGNDEVIDFMKYWLGYALTPSMERQEFLVVWGETAGNGKSTLFSDLFTKLLTGTDGDMSRKFHHTLNIKDMLTTTGQNSDTIYNLAGKRYAVMSEPKLNKKQKIDNEVIKRLTGDSSFSVSAKYCNEITFKPLSKIVALCNAMINVDVADAGLLRRMLVVEMNTKFVDVADYEKLKPKDKESGRFQIRDTTLIKRLQDNLEGVLKYFLEGAVAYTLNPKRVAPAVMYESKQRAVNELDDISSWITGYLEPDETPRASVSLRDLKTRWRSSNHHFTLINYNEMGFNKVFLAKCEQQGYKIHAKPGRLDEAKILGVREIKDEDDVVEE